MKKILFVAATALLCLLISCNDSETKGNTDADKQAKNKADFEMIYHALETGDVSHLDSIIDKDIVDHGNPMGDVKGIDSVKKWFTDFHSMTKDVKVVSIANASNDDYAFDWNRMTGTFTAPMMGNPAGPFEITTLDVVKLNKDGKAVEHWSYMDPKEMMKMMGAPPPPPAENKMSADTTKK
jgi:predicted SnoaL-like aldol condensation-catalyzing enzyme